jgi:hypothetical protein
MLALLMSIFSSYATIALFAMLYALEEKNYTSKQAMAWGIFWPVFFFDYLMQGYKQIRAKSVPLKPCEKCPDCPWDLRT